MKKPLVFPVKTPAESPEEWDKFWRDYGNIKQQMSVEDRKIYNAKYYAERKRLKLIARMQSLIDQFPDQARDYLAR